MPIRFSASQSVIIPVHDQPLPIQHYLKQPQRLVKALIDPSRMQILDLELFRLSMRSFDFMTVHIQPVVDLKVWNGPQGGLCLKSLKCQICSNEDINRRFHLSLDGFLAPTTHCGETRLEGTARLVVDVDLPPALWLTPRTLLETTGNGLLKSVLLTIKQRLSRQLLVDYYAWVKSQEEKSSTVISRTAMGSSHV
ncbi:DUF1997 domain-containing protein [Pseudanabaena sp. FACHB-2040]|uniref:DUF1997 domain-containing protein n=1 Tax=Pseudanabaena sp. FACHB-2040 TaxID=2692859 RepID=UPI001685615E|nr:DUF1997 domain-containing protein [Pseudanabaena sp. FACHB-2040]MBD2260299.1 DUF1997 domain-containing protein [Pseudanabaena sp. FACHB-2040]